MEGPGSHQTFHLLTRGGGGGGGRGGGAEGWRGGGGGLLPTILSRARQTHLARAHLTLSVCPAPVQVPFSVSVPHLSRTQKLSSPVFRTQSWQMLSFYILQNIAMHASPTARNVLSFLPSRSVHHFLPIPLPTFPVRA